MTARSDKLYFEHAELVKSSLNDMESRKVIAFAATCCERQLLIYDRSRPNNNRWSRTSILEKYLNIGWSWAINLTPLPQNMDTDNIFKTPSEIENDLGFIAIDPLRCIQILLNSIITFDICIIIEIPRINLFLIEQVLSLNYPAINDLELYHEFANADSFSATEIARQLDDIHNLKQMNEENISQSISNLCIHSKNINMVGDLRFDLDG